MSDIVLTGLFFTLGLFLPGYLAVGWFTNQEVSGANLDRRRCTGVRAQVNRPLGTIEAAFLSIVLSVSLTGILALVLAQVGFFSLPVLLIVLALAIFGMAGTIWYRGIPLAWQVAASPKMEWLAVAAITLGGAMLFLHPHQFVFGAADAGVYVNLGANLDRTGALLIQEPLLAEIPPGLLPGLLREQAPGSTTRYIRLPGFYLSDTVPGQVIPQFYPLHPVWLGIGYSLFGTNGALLAAPVWAVLSLVAVYLCGRALFDRQIGLLAAFILLIVPLQIYFARYPTAEPLTQFLTWVFLWAFVMFSSSRSPRSLWGLAAGLAFGQVFLTRIDALPMLIVPAIWAFVLLWRKRWDSSEWWFWLPLVALTGYAFFHGLAFSRPYTMDTYGWFLPFVRKLFWLVILLALLVVGTGLYLVTRQRRSVPGWLHGTGILRGSAATVLVGLGIYAYFFRPRLGSVVMAPYWYAGSQIPLTNHENLVRLGWYLSPLGIGLAIAGAVLFLFYERWSTLWPLWGVGGIFSVVYVSNILSNPFHIYAMRRYVPVVVPFFVLAAAFAIMQLWRLACWRKIGRGASILLLVLLVGWLAYNDRLIWKQVDYQGATEQVENLADLFQDRAVVLFVDEPPVGLGAILGTPLQFLYGITAFDLQEDELDIELLEEQVERWLGDGRPVYIARNPDTSFQLFERCLTLAGVTQIDTPIMEQTYDHVPSMITHVTYEVEVFRLGRACQPEG
jgi:4-amino-4-deoxy-L-arabinose transferase-like glycosyltransferase